MTSCLLCVTEKYSYSVVLLGTGGIVSIFDSGTEFV